MASASILREVEIDVTFNDGAPQHVVIGSFAPNTFGLFDMHGNVCEWCADGYGQYDLPMRDGDGKLEGADSRWRRTAAVASCGRLRRRARPPGPGSPRA